MSDEGYPHSSSVRKLIRNSTSEPTVNEHLRNVYSTGEINEAVTIRNFRIVQTEDTREVAREVDRYNLDAIISVGYRVNFIRATEFRQWATQVLHTVIDVIVADLEATA